MDTLLQVNAALAHFVWYASLKGSLLVVLLLLARRLLANRLSVSARYLVWLAVLAGFATPVGFTMAVPQLPGWSSVQAGPQQVAVDGQDPASGAPIAPGAGEPGLLPLADADGVHGGLAFLDEALPLVWLSGALLFMATVLVRHIRFSAAVRAAVPAGPSLQALLDDCRRQARCRRDVRLLCTPGVATPLVTGCLRPRLLLPADAAGQLGEAQLRHVFLHELMHVRNHDIAANWLLAVVQALHWFNPLAWIGFNRLRLDRELARDAATLQCLAAGDRHEYGRTLLQLSQWGNGRLRAAGVLGMVDAGAQLRARILMTVQGSLPARLPRMLVVMLFLLFGALAFSRPVFDRVAPAPVPVVVPVAAGGQVRIVAAAAGQGSEALVPIPAPSVAARKRSAVARDTATPEAVIGEATGVGIRALVATAAEPEPVPVPVPMIAAEPAQVAVAAAPQPEPVAEAAVVVAETYPDWSAIQALAKAAEKKRDHAVQSITRWNTLAESCGVTQGEISQRSARQESCNELYESLHEGQISRFWQQCRSFIKEHNRLATRFARAVDSRFVDRHAVGDVVAGNFRTLSEFCNTDVYVQRYPKMLALLRNAWYGVPASSFWWNPQLVRGAVSFQAPFAAVGVPPY